MVTAALHTISVNSPSFTGVSCSIGGLTFAAKAGIQESITWMQSGNLQSIAAPRYVRLTDPNRLYYTWRAFRF